MILLELIDLYSLVVLVAVVLSWIQLPLHHPVVRFVDTLTAPALTPIRRILPPMAGLDFSPMVLLVLLQLLKGVIAGAL
jgi:YggT family protein